MNWAAMAGIVIGAIVIVAGSVMALLSAAWRMQEKRDNVR